MPEQVNFTATDNCGVACAEYLTSTTPARAASSPTRRSPSFANWPTSKANSTSCAVDAPCTGASAHGSATDAKWQVEPGALSAGTRPKRSTAPFAEVKAGGRIAYITCSVLDEENGAQIRNFTARHPDFFRGKARGRGEALGDRAYMFGKAALVSAEGLLMTPRRTDTDGFFVSLLRRAS